MKNIDVYNVDVLRRIVSELSTAPNHQVLAQVVASDGTVFNVGLTYSRLESGMPYFQMSHPDLGIYSIKDIENIPEGHIRLPKSKEEAQAMIRLGQMYLENNE